MNIRYRVELSQEERDQLTAFLSGGKHPARKIRRAQILLAADAGIGDQVIAASVSVGEFTVYHTKRRFVEGNLELALAEAARPGAARKLPAAKKLCWWPRPVQTRRRGGRGGRWICWRAR